MTAREQGRRAPVGTGRTPAVRGPAGLTRRRGGDRGQAALEFAGLVTFLLIAGLAAIQLGLVAYAVQQAGTGARAGARAAGDHDFRGSPQAVGDAAMSGWLHAHVSVRGARGGPVTATARVRIPAVIPLFHFGTATRTVTMPGDR
jgi:hypothetical protein